MDEPNSGAATSASRKDRFDLCIRMLEAYYGALEGRLEKSVGLLVVVIGWLVASDDARRALKEPIMFVAALATLTVVVTLYCWNVVHWVRRFRQVQASADSLLFVDRAYYTRYRYQHPRWVTATYLLPVLLLYAFAVACLMSIVPKAP